MKMTDSFDGLSGFVMDYNIHQNSLHTSIKWPISFDTSQYEYQKALYLKFLQPLCTTTLQTLLKELRNYALRKGKFTFRNSVCLTCAFFSPIQLNEFHYSLPLKMTCYYQDFFFSYLQVKPRVRLMKQQFNSQSGGARLTCLATGFYPRHINMTLLKDGQGIPEHLFTVDNLLPNTDGTYQMRKTVEISEEELQQKHNYTCTATHLDQDNKMDVYWGTATSLYSVAVISPLIRSVYALKGSSFLAEMLLTDDRPGPNITVIITSILFVCVIAPTAAFLLYKRRRAGKNADITNTVISQNDYEVPSETDFCLHFIF